MDEFLKSVERRAFRMAQIATRSTEDALDIVQDTMFILVRRYTEKSAEEWRPLFFRILQNKIRDWHRRQTLRNRWFIPLPHLWKGRGEDSENTVETLADPKGSNPGDQVVLNDSLTALESELRALPLRQQQAFLLRAWEGLSVRETAGAMNCSEGTVKTHYARAIQTLRSKLEDHGP